jgi:glucose/arabinose dehydrogenase
MSPLKPVPTTLLALGLLASGLAGGAALPAAADVPAGFTERRVVGGLTSATDMAFAPNGRLFVTLKGGMLQYPRRNGTLATVLDFSRKVDDLGERGLLGIAVDPRFRSNRRLYLVYTHRATATLPTHNRLVRVTVRNGRLVPGSERLLFRFNAVQAGNHNGGSVHVGPDGKLYVSHGENARRPQAQTLRTLLGKIVRLNRNGSIPRDNPFYNRTTGRNRAIWALGLRNPFKFAFDPGSSRAFVNDVGAQTWEEINRLRGGSNYGWPNHEGPESARRFVAPLFAYRHGDTATTGCSITGGEFYRAERRNFPAGYVGDYFFADLCGGWVRRYDPRTDRVTPFAGGLGRVVDLEVSRGGALYALVIGTPGHVVRIRFTP